MPKIHFFVEPDVPGIVCRLPGSRVNNHITTERLIKALANRGRP